MSQPPPAPPRSSNPLFMPSRRPSGTGGGQPSRLPPTISTAGAGASGSYSRLPGATAAAGLGQNSSSAARYAQAMEVDSSTEGGGVSPAPRSATEQGVSPTGFLTANPTTNANANRPISRLPGSSSASPNPSTSAAATANGLRPSRLTTSTINRAHPGVHPPSRPTAPSAPSLDRTLRRLLLLLPSLLEAHSAPPLPLLDGLFPGEVREGFEAKWKEEEKRKGEERRTRIAAALKESESEVKSYVRNMVEEVGGGGVAGAERLEKLEKGLKELLEREGDEEKMERMEKRIQSLEASLARQRTAYEAQLQSYESRFSALESRLSSHPPSAPPLPEGEAYITQTDLQGYADKVDQALQKLDVKGEELARRVGVEWRRAPKEGEEVEEGGLLGLLEAVRAGAEAMWSKVEAVEERIVELELEKEQKESKEERGDVEMKDGKSEEAELLPRLLALESTLTALQSSLPTPSTPATSPSNNASLEAQLQTLQLTTSTLQTELEAKLQSQADKTGEKLEALRKLTTYFQTDNRLHSFDQLTQHWPALKLIIQAWKAPQPAPAPAVADAAPSVNGGGKEDGGDPGGEAAAATNGGKGREAAEDMMENQVDEDEEQQQQVHTNGDATAEVPAPSE